ncbi:MAG: hypothetical protein HKN47_26945 [Pirellulaceae bacterium]|nr:hypothetical protein [Pirellulaceae bacterium]
MNWRIGLWIMVVALSSQGDATQAQSPSLMDQLTQRGVTIPEKHVVLVPPPTLADHLTAEQRRQKLSALAGGATWKQFSRDSVVAPVAIDLDYIKDDDGARIGHSIHVAFVVHTPIETFADEDLMEQIFGDRDKSDENKTAESQKLSDDQLGALGIEPVESTSFTRTRFTLLKKVLVNGVLQTETAATNDTKSVAVYLDPRFSDDNWWMRVSNDQAAPASKKNRYVGAGGYVVIARLTELDGASLVEARFILHEPQSWFSGSNLLRSKLPLMIQESARKFRRKLK